MDGQVAFGFAFVCHAGCVFACQRFSCRAARAHSSPNPAIHRLRQPRTACSRLRRIDTEAISEAKRVSELNADLDADFGMRSAPEPGLPVDYCIFCYHGTGMLRHDNTALLSKFVTERGALLPKRFTKACAKHQRKLNETVQRARWMNLIPFHGKLHPRLRFTSMKPSMTIEASTAGIAPSFSGRSAPAAAAFDQRVAAASDLEAAAARKSQVNQYLKDINASSSSPKAAQ